MGSSLQVGLTPEQHAMRRTGIAASEVEAVLGLPDGPLDELDHELASILREVEAQQAAAEAERADRLNVSTAAFRDSVAQTAEETDHERA